MYLLTALWCIFEEVDLAKTNSLKNTEMLKMHVYMVNATLSKYHEQNIARLM